MHRWKERGNEAIWLTSSSFCSLLLIIAAIGPAALQISAEIVGVLLAASAVQLMISAGIDLGVLAKQQHAA